MGVGKGVSTPTRTASSPADIASMFNEYFTSVFSTKEHSDPTPTEPKPSDHALCDVSLTTEDVSEALLALDPNKATDPDGFPCRLLKETARQIALSLTQVFNLSPWYAPGRLETGEYHPCLQKGEKQCVDNYRPISLLSVVSKVLERCVLGKIRDHIFCLISCIQHGFTSGKPCTTQLLEVHDHIGSLQDPGKQTDIIYKVDHTLLLSKLQTNFLISGNLLSWFRSYLLGRRQRVNLLGTSHVRSPPGQPRSQGLSSSRPSERERERETLVGAGHVTAHVKLLPSRGTLAQLFYSQEPIRDFQAGAI